MSNKRFMYIPMGMIIFMCMGTVYSWSIFRKPLEQLFNIDSASSGFPYTVFLVFYAVGMPIAGKYIDKFGPKLITIVGGLVISAGWILASFGSSIGFLTLTFGLMGGIGVGFVYGAPMAVSAKWFPDKKGLAVGLTLAGFGASSFVTAPVCRALIEQYGPMLTFRYVGIAFAFIMTILALPLRFPKDHEIPESSNGNNLVGMNLKEVLKEKDFYILWITFLIGTFVGLMVISVVSPIAQEMGGFSSTAAAGAMAIFAIFNAVGRPLFGELTDRFRPKKVMVASYILIIIASLLMYSLKTGEGIKFYIASSIIYLVFGGWLSIAPTSLSNIFGPKYNTHNYGYLFTAYGVAAIFSLVGGKIRSTYGSYQNLFIPTIIVAIIGIFVSGFLLNDKSKV